MNRDLVLHFFAGVVLGLVGWGLVSPQAGVLLSLVVGAGKEIVWDLFLRRGTPDVADFGLTLAGGVTVYIFAGALQ